MDGSISAIVVGVSLVIGSAAGVAEKMNNSVYYDNFLNNPDNYHLVDDAGESVTQELK